MHSGHRQNNMASGRSLRNRRKLNYARMNEFGLGTVGTDSDMEEGQLADSPLHVEVSEDEFADHTPTESSFSVSKFTAGKNGGTRRRHRVGL